MSRHQYRRGKTPFRRGGSDSTPSPRVHGQCCALRGRTSNAVLPREYGQCRSRTRAGRACMQTPAAGNSRAGFRHEGRSRVAIRLTELCRAAIRQEGHFRAAIRLTELFRAIIRHAGRSRAIIRRIPCLRWRTIAQERRMCPNIARKEQAWGNPARKRQVRSKYPQLIFGAHALPY